MFAVQCNSYDSIDILVKVRAHVNLFIKSGTFALIHLSFRTSYCSLNLLIKEGGGEG